MLKLITLESNQEKLKIYNDLCEELKILEPNINWEEEKIQNIKDVFYPYNLWLEELSKEENVKTIKDLNKNLDNIYISQLNWEEIFDNITAYKFTNKYDEYNYGVCDNASQVLNYCEKQLIEGELDENKKYIIVLTPFFKKHQPKYEGWRWHKWGEYIGVQNPQHEYLADEDNIDVVYVFDIKEVKKIL